MFLLIVKLCIYLTCECIFRPKVVVKTHAPFSLAWDSQLKLPPACASDAIIKRFYFQSISFSRCVWVWGVGFCLLIMAVWKTRAGLITCLVVVSYVHFQARVGYCLCGWMHFGMLCLDCMLKCMLLKWCNLNLNAAALQGADNKISNIK